MKRVRPLLRASLLGMPLLLGGCMADVIPGPDTTDTSCMLLCALQRQFTGEPAPAPPAPAATGVTPKPGRAVHRTHASPAPRTARPVPAKRRLRRAHRRPAAHVSVVPQAPPREPPPVPVAIEPPGPAPVAVTPPPVPAEPARSLSEAIPGSARIMTPEWRQR